MALTFTRAQQVAPGEEITSTQMRSLAAAWNDRILSGVGDVAWRFSMYLFNLWRLIRNPSGSLFPPLAEFDELYKHIDPEYGGGLTWPVADPGEEEGANLASPMPQFVFGVGDLGPEDVRLEASCPLYINGGPPVTLEDHWELAKLQRGVYDPITTGQNWPAAEAAQSIFAVTAPWYSPHLKSYGGFFPQPPYQQYLGAPLVDCGDGDTTDAGYLVPSFAYFFTALRPEVPTTGLHGVLSTGASGNPVVTYPGSCPCNSNLHAIDHVAWISRGPLSTHVWGAIARGVCEFWEDVLPNADWIEGPYEGATHLQRTEGGQIRRAVNAFAADFRGTPEQRGGHATFGRAGLESAAADDFAIEEIALDAERFYLSQYPLAPARAREDGAELTPLYPICTIRQSQESGYVPPFDGATTEHQTAEGFCIAGLFAKATRLRSPCRIAARIDGRQFATLILTPDADGASQALTMTCRQAPVGKLSFALLTVLDFTSADGQLVIESAELLQYKPGYWDGYLVARLMATAGGDQYQGGVDGRGLDQSDANDYIRRLHTFGSLHNTKGAAGPRMSDAWINDNPVYDTARRLSRDLSRIWSRALFQSYEVAGGKSILRFKRFCYDMQDERVDAFHGIAPPIDPIVSGELIEGETYVVRAPTGGTIVYGAGNFADGDTFTAYAPKDFEAIGEAALYVKDGVRQTALKRGWSNRWVVFLNTKPFHTSDSSTWKLQAYSDFFTYVDRCVLATGRMPSAEFKHHVCYQYNVELDTAYWPWLLPPNVQATILAPEVPSGLRYALGTNYKAGMPAGFCPSCQVYVQPYEIESCTVDDWDLQTVKVVLKRRLDYHPDAAVTIYPDPGKWSVGEKAALVAEAYRTDDNALREWELFLDDATTPSWKVGDAGVDSGITGNPFGSVVPHFFGVKLMPEPYEDGNAISEPHDARCTVDALVQAEMLTRAGCEGFVDARTSVELACAQESGGVYDYRFEILCYDAFGNRWIGAFDDAERPDNPEFFGPLPNTTIRASVFNRLAAAVNLLDKARLHLPATIQYRERYWEGSEELTGVQGTTCSESGYMAAWKDSVSPPAASETAPGAWMEGTFSSFQSTAENRIHGCPYHADHTKLQIEWRLGIDSELLDALRPDLQALITAGSVGIIGRTTTETSRFTRETAAYADSDGCCLGYELPCPGFYFDGVDYFRWVESTTSQVTCGLVEPGLIEAPAPPASDLNIGRSISGADCFTAASTSTLLELFSEQIYLRVPLADLPG